MTERTILGHQEIAELIVDTVNVYGRQVCLRYGNEDRLVNLIATSLQAAFDRGFRAAGGSVTPLPRAHGEGAREEKP